MNAAEWLAARRARRVGKLEVLLEHDRAALFRGDSSCLGDVLAENSVDALVFDPPAGIGFMGKGWDGDKGGRDAWIRWLADTLAPSFRALKPGGHALSWAIPRTSHWTATALELAGFEIRDVHHDMLAMDDVLAAFLASLDTAQGQALARILESSSSPILYHLFGTGFPKSLDISKAIDAALGATERRRKIGEGSGRTGPAVAGHADVHGDDSYKWPGVFDITSAATELAARWSGFGTALKPAVEHWILARKPLDGTYAANVMRWGTGALNVDGCRIDADSERPLREHTGRTGGVYGAGLEGSRAIGSTNVGRWPAHLSLDERTSTMLDEQAGERRSGSMSAGTPRGENSVFGKASGVATTTTTIEKSAGGASRFFYVAKSPRKEKDAGLDHLPARTGGEATDREEGSAGTRNPRAGAGRTGGARNVHPTCKNITLMRWLVRLVTPPGGIVLDPFAGSGSTGVAALAEGMTFVGCELGGDNREYLPILVGRIRHALGLSPR